MNTIEQITADIERAKCEANDLSREILMLKIRYEDLKRKVEADRRKAADYIPCYEEEVEALCEDNDRINKWLSLYDFTDNVHRKHKWGYEQWIVNNALYCAKMLVLTNPNVVSSVHKHNHKCETFIGCEGEVTLIVECGESKHFEVKITPGITYSIPSNFYHSFYGEGSILEVSTPDNDDNVKKIPAKEMVK